MLERLFAVLIVLALAPTAAVARYDVAEISGVWAGRYACDGRKANMRMIITPEGGRFSFAYEDGVRGEYEIDVSRLSKTKVRIRPGAWLERPDGYRALRMLGVLEARGDAMSGDLSGCEGWSAKKTGEKAVLPSRPAQPRLVDRKPTPKLEPGQMPAASGRWEGEGACLHGPTHFSLEFEAPDAAGADAVLSVRTDEFPRPLRLRAQVRRSGEPGQTLTIEAEAPSGGKFAGKPIVIALARDGGSRGRMIGESTGVACGRVAFAPARSEIREPTAEERDGDAFASKLVGDWEGAFDDDRARMTKWISLSIRPAQITGGYRRLEVDLTYGDASQLSVVRGKGSNLSLDPDLRLDEPYSRVNASMWFGPSSLRRSGHVLKSSFSNGNTSGAVTLWRRLEGAAPLSETCDRAMKWLSARNDARNRARDLKVEFFPSLNSYDVDRASLAEGLRKIPPELGGTTEALIQSLGRCAIALPNIDMLTRRGLFDGVLDSRQLERARRDWADDRDASGPPVFEALSAPGMKDAIVSTDKAEKALPELLTSGTALSGSREVLAFIERNAAALQPVPPSVLAEAMRPLSDRMRTGDSVEAAKADDVRRRLAADRMRGVMRPPGEATFPALVALTSGERVAFTRDALGYLAGMLAESGERCGEPSPTVRLRLAELLKQGVQLGLGANFSGSIQDMISTIGRGSVTFAAGSEFVKSIGCGSPYISAVFDLLVKALDERALQDAARPGRFVRSCALDKPVEMCACAAKVVSTIHPGIENMEYSQSLVSSANSRNPTVGIELMSRCGMMRY